MSRRKQGSDYSQQPTTEGAVILPVTGVLMLPPVVSRANGGELGLLGSGQKDRRAVAAREAP